jgi:hypothetical protein
VVPILDAMTFGELFNCLGLRTLQKKRLMPEATTIPFDSTALPNLFDGIPIDFGKWQILVGDVH